jgi:pimeloyl-ACP methyl ester carboxylesterase
MGNSANFVKKLRVLKIMNTDIGGNICKFAWNWQNQEVSIVYETLGNGSPVLLLPAFSTVSTRSEMAGIAQLLAPHFQVFAVDFPGFGDSSRLPFDYQPALYHQFLQDFITSIFPVPVMVVAAGHSAAYILQLGQELPNLFSHIALIAPTWRGPLPTMGANPNIAGFTKDLIRLPLLGQFLYKLNTAPSFLKWMYSRHVYIDMSQMTDEFVQYKWNNTQKSGARFAPAAFVTGKLDAVHSQGEFLELARDLSVPLMEIIGESSPPKSRLEMDALALLPNVQSQILPGTLGMHEEYSHNVVEAIMPFLRTIS